MKLFLPMSGFLDGLKIQSALNKLKMNFLENVDVMIAKAVMDVMVDVMVAMLAFMRRLSLEF
jgi:hypothetical protein